MLQITFRQTLSNESPIALAWIGKMSEARGTRTFARERVPAPWAHDVRAAIGA